MPRSFRTRARPSRSEHTYFTQRAPRELAAARDRYLAARGVISRQLLFRFCKAAREAARPVALPKVTSLAREIGDPCSIAAPSFSHAKVASKAKGVLTVKVSTGEGGARRLLDGSTSTHWESSSSSKPHWVELSSEGACCQYCLLVGILLRKRSLRLAGAPLGEVEIYTKDWSNSFSPARVEMHTQAPARGRIQPPWRKVRTHDPLTTAEGWTQLLSAAECGEANHVRIEIHTCGPSQTGTNCKVLCSQEGVLLTKRYA